jgi:predicted dehydrogenase
MRIGLIGCSGHAGYVLDGVRDVAEAQLVAVAPGCPDEDMSGVLKSKAVVAANPAVYADHREMLDRERLDAVGVNPFHSLHAATAADALSRGVPAFVEKPLALDAESLAEVRRSRAATGAPVGLMLNYRYIPAFYTARQVVAAGRIGEPVVGYAQKSYKLGTRPDFYKKRETFGGLIPWVGIHAIDWFQWISGRRYTAVTGRHGNRNAPAYPEMEDNATCLFELDNGGSAVMSFDYLRPGAAPSHGDDRLRLACTEGVLEIRDGQLSVLGPDGPLDIPLQAPAHGLCADFLLSLREGGRRCGITTEAAFRATAVALKARDAADRQERVTLL